MWHLAGIPLIFRIFISILTRICPYKQWGLMVTQRRRTGQEWITSHSASIHTLGSTIGSGNAPLRLQTCLGGHLSVPLGTIGPTGHKNDLWLIPTSRWRYKCSTACINLGSTEKETRLVRYEQRIFCRGRLVRSVILTNNPKGLDCNNYVRSHVGRSSISGVWVWQCSCFNGHMVVSVQLIHKYWSLLRGCVV